MKYKCLMCNEAMKLDKNLGIHKGKHNFYRIRRFSCSVCDYSELLTADGKRDLDEHAVLQDVQNYFKQEEINRI